MIKARLPCSKFRWIGKRGHCSYFPAGTASCMAVLLHLTTANLGVYEH
jgi:hypothetical protein